MNYHTLAGHLTKFIAQQEEIAGLWNGKNSGQIEDDAQTASYLIELADPLLGELKRLIANESKLNSSWQMLPEDSNFICDGSISSLETEPGHLPDCTTLAQYYANDGSLDAVCGSHKR